MPALSEQQIWDEIFAHAAALKQQAGTASVVGGIKGRSIALLAEVLAKFWAKHKNELMPFLSTLAIAALEGILQNLVAIKSVNEPGPR